MFRRTDTVNTWGVVRDRDSGVVPAVVTISLSALDSDTGDAGPAIVSHEVHPNKRRGVQRLDQVRGPAPRVSTSSTCMSAPSWSPSTGIQVDRILKPAYRLDVTTGRRVYVAGDTIRITANAGFYEGSPVPGIRLRLDGIVSGGFTTDETGTATRRTIARVGRNEDGRESDGSPEVQSIDLTPASAEEGEITGSSREIVVFPSNWVISGTATVRDGRVRATGHLNELDRDRVEREVNGGEDPWSLDPAGKALAGRTVTLTFYRQRDDADESGTRYDFIEKKVVADLRIPTDRARRPDGPGHDRQQGTLLGLDPGRRRGALLSRPRHRHRPGPARRALGRLGGARRPASSTSSATALTLTADPSTSERVVRGRRPDRPDA